ncbi:DUF222 domain-containing protein [Corynebacterium sp. H128]|uniref:HNH endonuclease signature motif containing protein n=1 Tax=Corynebacterium sp. H128 TaxID=3133427 RepID=UPI0030ACEBC0
MKGFEQIDAQLAVALSAQLEALSSLENPVVSAEDLHKLLENARRIERLAQLTTLTLLRELESQQAFDPNARASFNRVLHSGRFDRSELRNASKLADELFDKPASVGTPEGRPARMPHTAAGLQAAAFGVASAMEIRRVLDQIPESTAPEAVAWAESTLAELATTLAPEDLRKAGLKILQGLNADAEPNDKERQRKRSVCLSNQGADLMSAMKVTATPELDALLRRLFADYAGPGDLLPEEQKKSDARTVNQRRHDALVVALKNALHRTGPMSPTRGCSTVVATMTIEQLAAAAGVVPTDVGTLLPIPDLLRLGADKNAFLALLEAGTGNLIELGRSKRAADIYAYLGLLGSQGGDMTPGSDLPAAMCEIHHLKAWRFGGMTTGNNLMFVGHRVHRNIDDTQQNPDKYWTFCDKTGQMLWRQPAKLEPDRPAQANFNPTTWFNPGQLLRFGIHEPDAQPPFQIPVCRHCQTNAA